METNEQTEKIVNEVVERAKEQFNTSGEVVEQKGLMNVAETIEKQYKKSCDDLATSEDFIKATDFVVKQGAEIKIDQDKLLILQQEQLNDLAEYYVKCEKEKLEFRKKKEKKLILEEVKADIVQKKIEILKKKYGYMYKENEQFIPSKSYNRQRELVNWWNGLSVNVKKTIKGIFRIAFWGAIAVLGFTVGRRVLLWIMENVKFN